MISFMLHEISWLSVILAALAGLIIGMVWHLLFGRLCDKFEKGWCKECDRCEKDEHRCCASHGHKHGEDGCRSMFCMLWHKLGAFAIFFAQAYGLAFILENLDLLSDLSDAIYVAIFIGLTFAVSHLYAMVIWHHKSFKHFLFKAVYKLFILSAMAWIFVYFAAHPLMA